jgi:hypothetical protein
LDVIQKPQNEAAGAPKRDQDQRHEDVGARKGARKKDKEKKGWKRKFCLADVEAILDPLVVVPNIGGRLRCEYLMMKPRSQWVDIFKKWMDDPHDDDKIPLTEPVPVHNILHL